MDLQQLKSSWKNHVRVCQKCNTEDMRRSKNTPPSNSIAFWSISKKSYNLGNCLVLLIYLKRIRKKSMRKSIFNYRSNCCRKSKFAGNMGPSC